MGENRWLKRMVFLFDYFLFIGLSILEYCLVKAVLFTCCNSLIKGKDVILNLFIFFCCACA